jgi:oxygen-dependent protoporphyrinogen oxidase
LLKNDSSFTSHPIITVVGGGITGLAAAWQLQQLVRAQNLPYVIHLVEAADRLGGKIITEQIDGLTIEGGPDCFIRQKPYAAELAAAVGLKDELIDTNDHQRKTYVVNKGKLTPLPDGVMLIVPTRIMPFVTSPLISWPGKIRMGMDFFVPPFKGADDESVAQFVKRRLGTEALEKIAEPLLSGIHVSDPETQSLLATFPRFRNLEQKYGNLIKGMLVERKRGAAARKNGQKPASVFQSLRGGMSQLTATLEKALVDCIIHKGTRVTRLEQMDGQYQLTLSSGETLHSDAVILAIPAFQAASLLRPLHLAAAVELDRINYVSTATISMAFRKSEIAQPFMGFGMVVPRQEKRKISACTWSSFKFNHRAPDDLLLLRCFVGGPGKEAMVDLSDEELIQTVREELKDLLELDAKPVMSRIYRWVKANPQYDLGHLERVGRIFNEVNTHLPGIFLTGSAYEGVGVPDCVRQGRETAKKVFTFLNLSLEER